VFVCCIKAQETRADKTFFKLLALHTNQPSKAKQQQRAAKNPIHNNLLNFIRGAINGIARGVCIKGCVYKGV